MKSSMAGIAAYSYLFLCSLPAFSKENTDVYYNTCGRLMSASLKFPPNLFRSVTGSPAGETVEDVISELQVSGRWNKFTLIQKTELTFFALIFCDLQGGESVAFAQMLGADGPKIGKKIAVIKDEHLRDKFNLSKAAINKFRRRMEFVTGMKAMDR